MKGILIVLTLMFLIISCERARTNSGSSSLTYQNIVILSDLSSRLDNKPQKDSVQIRNIIKYFKDSCVKPGEKIGDKSSISFSTFTKNITVSIDLNEIKNISDKQQFINSTGKYENSGLNYQIENFNKHINGIYATTRNKGLDLISMLMEKIQNESIVKENTSLTDGIKTTNINFENHLYVFTDGYLEYNKIANNNQFYFGDAEIKKVRHFINANNVDITRALEMNKSLGLPPYKNAKNKKINLHIFETHERDKDDKLQTYKYPIGQRDNEILEAVWRKWATESGFKSFEWKKY